MQLAAPLAASVLFPAVQYWHVFEITTPTAADAFPAAQLVHCPKPPEAAKVPALHPIQNVLPASEVSPVPHVVHRAAPAVAAYAPTGHAAQLVELAAPAAAVYVPAAHGAQAAASVAPRVAEYWPEPHGVQLAPPASVA